MGYDRVVERARKMDAEARMSRQPVARWRMSLDMWEALGEFSRHKAPEYRRPTDYVSAYMCGHVIWVDPGLPPRSLMLE